MGQPFKDTVPDPGSDADRRRAYRIREAGKKAPQAQRDWLVRYDAACRDAKSAVSIGPTETPAPAPAPPAPTSESASSPTHAKPDEVGAASESGAFSPPLPVQSVEPSSAKPAPVPALGSATVPPRAPTPAPPRSAPKSTPAQASAPSPANEDKPLLAAAADEVQRARVEALTMVFDLVAQGFEELHTKVTTTMQGQNPIPFPMEFWRGPWRTMAVGLFNRYLPEWMSGPLVEGVAVAIPPVIVVRVASKLEAAGYELGVPGEPGRSRSVAQGGAKPTPSEAVKPDEKPAEKPADEAPPRMPPEKTDKAVANPPAKRPPVEVNGKSLRGLFVRGPGPNGKA